MGKDETISKGATADSGSIKAQEAWNPDLSLTTDVQTFMQELVQAESQEFQLEYFSALKSKLQSLINRLSVSQEIQQMQQVSDYWNKAIKRSANAHIDNFLHFTHSTSNEDDMPALSDLYRDLNHSLHELHMTDEIIRLLLAIRNGSSEFARFCLVEDIEFKIRSVADGYTRIDVVKEAILSAEKLSNQKKEELLNLLGTAGMDRVLSLIGMYEYSVATMAQWRNVYDDVLDFLLHLKRTEDYLKITKALREKVVEHYRTRLKFSPGDKYTKTLIKADDILFSSDKETLLAESGKS